MSRIRTFLFERLLFFRFCYRNRPLGAGVDGGRGGGGGGSQVASASVRFFIAHVNSSCLINDHNNIRMKVFKKLQIFCHLIHSHIYFVYGMSLTFRLMHIIQCYLPSLVKKSICPQFSMVYSADHHQLIIVLF